MVTLFIGYDTVLKEYEKESQYLIDILRNSNSKYKDTKVEKMKWFYDLSYFKRKGNFTEEYYENLFNMKFEDRLNEELKKIRVSLSMSAGKFSIMDRVEGLSNTVKEAVKIVTIQKMINEQSKIGNHEVIDSIPIPREEQVPMSLEDQLKRAIEVEDYEDAVRIRDEMKTHEDEI